VELKFTEDYPLKKPEIKFLTKIYHPNINASGKVCVDILNNWNPDLRVHDGQ
jgi:ubiquitin-conjugating enzyme E2 N